MSSISVNRLLTVSGVQCERFGGRIVYYPIQSHAFKGWLKPSTNGDQIHILSTVNRNRCHWLCKRILSALQKVASANSYPYAHYHWYIQGEFTGVMDDGYLLETLFTLLLCKMENWPLDSYGCAMIASKAANTIDPRYYGFADIYATLLSIDHPDEMIYLDTLMCQHRYIHILDGSTIEILPFTRLLINRIPRIRSFSKAGEAAFETLGIFYPIHSLASVSGSELNESKDQLSLKEYQAAHYVIFQSEASDAIASYATIKAWDLYRMVADLSFSSVVTTRQGRLSYGHVVATHPFCTKISKIYPCGHYGILLNWIKI